MRRSPQFHPMSAMKSLFVIFSALFLVLSVFGGNALATTPIAVTVYQDMESGNNGDVLTASIMNASSHGVQNWSAPSGTLWVSTAYHRDLPGPVLCGGVTYNGTGGSRCWQFSNTYMTNFVRLAYGSFSNISEACYYTTLTTLTYQNGYDVLNVWGGSFQCMQTLADNFSGGKGLSLHLHSNLPSTSYGLGTNNDPVMISITTGKTYWVTSAYDGAIGTCSYAAYDPDNSFAQVGTTLHAISLYNDSENQVCLGRNDAHGNQTNDLTYGYFDQLLVDSTNGTFPLLPSGANDTTAPSAPSVVRDGTGMDQSIALSTTQLSANWDPAVDNESGIKAYQYAIGTTQGGTNVVDWTTLKNARAVTKTGLSLTTGQTCYFSVRGINGVGLTGPAANSDGQTVGTDASAPSAPAAVRDGGTYNVSPDADSNPNPHSLDCNFDPATDNESGISYYQFAFGTSVGATDTVGWTNLPANALNWQGLGLNGWANGLNPPNGVAGGVRYYATVRAINNAGITGPAANSNGQIVVNTGDTTPPGAPPVVRDGTASTETSTTSSTTQLSANWDNGSDNESGIQCYFFRIGTTPGGSNVVSDTKANFDSPVSRATVTGLSLTVGQTYYFSVHSANGVWLASAQTNSSGVTVVSGSDTTPPSAPPTVRDGTGADISTTTSTTQLSANWDASTDNESGISGYQYAIGTSAGGTQTVNWTSLGNVTTVTKTGLTLSVGQTYFFSVKAVNGAGLTGSATNSNGQTVVTDSTPPSAPPAVRDGTGADISTTGSTTQLSANWDASTDNESGISGYQYAIGTSAGGTQTVNWTSLGNVTTVTKTGLTLSTGQTYFFSVKAVNGAGLTGSATNSNGQTVTGDSTPPSAPPAVRDGIGADISTTISTTQLSANWDASTDNESGISGYQYAIGTSAGGAQTVNWTSLGNVTTVTKTGLTLSVGQTYFFSVKAVNGVGLTGNATNSNGQTVVTDSTPPSAPANVRDGVGADISTTSSTTQLSANWDASTDGESGISGYQYAIGTSAGGTQTVNWTSLGNVTTVTKTGLTLSVGQTYFFSVRAVNGAGLTGSATNSNGQTVVTSSTATYFSDNFENWTVHGGAWTSTTGETGGSSLNTSTDHAAAGTKGLKVTYASTASSGMYLTKNFSPNYISGDVYLRFYAFFPTGFEAGNSQSEFLYLMAGNNGTNDYGQNFASVQMGNYGMLAMSLEGNYSGVNNWVTSSGLTENQWHCIEIHLSPLSTTTTMECWIEGVKSSTVLTYDLSGASTIDWIQFGDMNVVTASGATFYLDELVVANSYIGPLGSDNTPPSAPPAVRDGVGADISTTSSTTQLSANWDASTDNESGISGYQYAIGTSAGGTQTVNWTSLGNVTTVTKTGLTLSVGQTYYFSVKAVNGAGLTGGATNSNGQTVVSSAVTYFSDNFENWTVHGGAWSSVSGETATQTLNTSTDYARAGTKSLKLTDSDTTASYCAFLVENFSPTISGAIYVRFYVYLPTAYVSANTGAAWRRVLRVFCGTNRGQMSLAGATPVMEEVGSWGASQASSALSANAWHCIEMYMATPSSSTAMQFWVDGTSAGTLTGSFSGSTVYTSMQFGDVSVGSGANVTGTFYLDEVIASNAYNGPLP